MRLARSFGVASIMPLAEIARVDKLDRNGFPLQPLSELKDVDARAVTVAANILLDRGFGKPK
jgi:hypothetical protein